MGSNLVGNEIGTLFFFSVVLEGIWEGDSKPRRGSQGGGCKSSYSERDLTTPKSLRGWVRERGGSKEFGALRNP